MAQTSTHGNYGPCDEIKRKYDEGDERTKSSHNPIVSNKAGNRGGNQLTSSGMNVRAGSIYISSSNLRMPSLNDYVEVLWDAHDVWFRGRLVEHRGRLRKFRFGIQYDDGDFMTHDLNDEYWRFSDDHSKSYEPGEIDELYREVEEQSFSMPFNGTTKRKPMYRESGNAKKKRPTSQPLPHFPQLCEHPKLSGRQNQNDEGIPWGNVNGMSTRALPTSPKKERPMPETQELSGFGFLHSPDSGQSSPSFPKPVGIGRIQPNEVRLKDGTAMEHASKDGGSRDTHLTFRKRRFNDSGTP